MIYNFNDVFDKNILPRINDEGFFAVNADDFINKYRGQIYSRVSRAKNPDGIKLNFSKVDICNEFLAVAAAITARTGRMNVTTLMRELHIGYERAKETLIQLKDNGFIGDYDRTIRAYRYTQPQEKPAEQPVFVPPRSARRRNPRIEAIRQLLEPANNGIGAEQLLLELEPANDDLAQDPRTLIIPEPSSSSMAARLNRIMLATDLIPAAPVVSAGTPKSDVPATNGIVPGSSSIDLSNDPRERRTRWLARAAGIGIALITTAAVAFTALVGHSAPNSSSADQNASMTSFGSAASEVGNPAMNKDRPILVSIVKEAAPETAGVDHKRDGVDQASTAVPAQTGIAKDILLAAAGATTYQPNLAANNMIASNYALVSLNVAGSLGEAPVARHNRLCGDRDNNSFVQANLTMLEGGPDFIGHLQKAQSLQNPFSPDGRRAAFVVNVAAGLTTVDKDQRLASDADGVCSTTALVQPHMPAGPFTKGTLTLAGAIEKALGDGAVTVNFGDIAPPQPYAIKTGLVTGRYETNKDGWEKLGADFGQAYMIADFRRAQKMAMLPEVPIAPDFAVAAPVEALRVAAGAPAPTS